LPLKPEHLDFENAQILLIAEKSVEKALQRDSKDEEAGKEEPSEELYKLEHEDEERVKHLRGKRARSFLLGDMLMVCTGDDTIFEDLKISQKEYPGVTTTW
jgi:hypothetical protein